MDLQKILNKYGVNCDLRVILDKWNEPNRFYHDQEHLTDIISQINEDFGDGAITEVEREKLIITALFHDIIYDPTSNHNEEKSCEFFYNLCTEKFDIDVVEIKQMIIDTKNHVASTPLSKKFIGYDMSVCERGFEGLIEWENKLREEYSMYTDGEYKDSRIKFLESIVDKYPSNMDNLLDLINWVKLNY